MTQSRTPIINILLASGGVALLVVSVSFLMLLVRHRILAEDYGDTYFMVPWWLLAGFLVCSILVLLGSVLFHRNGRRLSITAMLLTVAAWIVGGVSWLVAGAS